MNETKDDLKREKVRIVPISNIEDFPDHPFQVKDDESMDALVRQPCSTVCLALSPTVNVSIRLKAVQESFPLSRETSRAESSITWCIRCLAPRIRTSMTLPKRTW